jgi:hypothetical protein
MALVAGGGDHLADPGVAGLARQPLQCGLAVRLTRFDQIIGDVHHLFEDRVHAREGCHGGLQTVDFVALRLEQFHLQFIVLAQQGLLLLGHGDIVHQQTGEMK